MTYMIQEGYQWKEDELIFTYMTHWNSEALKWVTFLIRTVCEFAAVTPIRSYEIGKP